MEWTGLLGFLGFCVPFAIAPFIIWLVIYTIRRNLKQHAERRDLTLNGVSAPGVIISARNNYFSGGGKNRPATTVHVTFEIEVQPDGEPPFKASINEALPIRPGGWNVSGPRPDDVGKKVWVAYDPKNRNRIALDYFDSDREFMTKRRAFEKIDQELQVVRKTGDDAIAEILETEDLNLANKMEHGVSTILRVKLRVYPKSGLSYEAETVNSFLNSGLHKYTPGKKVTVKIDRMDKNKIALVGAAPNA